jgi:hypothetical protein
MLHSGPLKHSDFSMILMKIRLLHQHVMASAMIPVSFLP